jgi:hypothetical protein
MKFQEHVRILAIVEGRSAVGRGALELIRLVVEWIVVHTQLRRLPRDWRVQQASVDASGTGVLIDEFAAGLFEA